MWREAGNAYVKSSECFSEIDQLEYAAKHSKEAAFCYSKIVNSAIL